MLGGTHYYMVAQAISDFLGESVRLISAGGAAARAMCTYLQNNDLLSDGKQPKSEFFTTGDVEEFAKTAQIMLGKAIKKELKTVKNFYKIAKL